MIALEEPIGTGSGDGLVARFDAADHEVMNERLIVGRIQHGAHREGVARRHPAILSRRTNRRVSLERRLRKVARLDRLAVIDECSYGKLLSDSRHPTEVITVKVGNQQIINASNAGVTGSCQNSLRVSIIKSIPARVDQERFARGVNDEGRLSAFHVDEIDLEILASRHCHVC